MSQEYRIMAAWGPLFNLTNGNIVVDDRHFTLVPNKALTAMAFSVGKGAYATRPYDIENIAGYENNFMAWMTILLRDGSKVKVSIGSKSKKHELIAALEQRRAALFAARGQQPPVLTSII